MELRGTKSYLENGYAITTSMDKNDGAIDIDVNMRRYYMTVWIAESVDPQSSPIPFYRVSFSDWDDLVINVEETLRYWNNAEAEFFLE